MPKARIILPTKRTQSWQHVTQLRTANSKRPVALSRISPWVRVSAIPGYGPICHQGSGVCSRSPPESGFWPGDGVSLLK